MAFLDKLGKKIGSAAGATANKAKEMAEITKLNSRRAAEEKQIEKYYTEIGKTVFELDKDNPESPVAELCAKIIFCQKNIEEFKQKVEEIKNAPVEGPEK